MTVADVDRSDPPGRAWIAEAVARIEADRAAVTPLRAFPLPASWRIELYVKDESVHPTGSIKHRHARALFLHALASGWLGPGTTVVTASAGSAAVAAAYHARSIGLPFFAVAPRSTPAPRIDLIERYGGRCHLVDRPPEMYDAARRLADEVGGHYLDHFADAERALDWRGIDDLAASTFAQVAEQQARSPSWVVVGAGTGATATTFGRYVRHRQHDTRLAVVDPEGSAFLGSFETGAADYTTGQPSRIPGIGRPRVEPGFVPTVIDRMMRVPDAASVAGMRAASEHLGVGVGPSTGTNLWGALRLVAELRDHGEAGCVVTLLCDGPAAYTDTYADDGWVVARGLDPTPYAGTIARFLADGPWEEPPA